MIRHIRISAVMMSCAAAAALGIGGTALASSAGTVAATSTGTIKACYVTTNSPAALKHVPVGASCPKGYTGVVWNKVGPRGRQGQPGRQGPPGVAVGSSGMSSTSANISSISLVPTGLSTSPVPDAGTYYVNASVTVFIATDDGVSCLLADKGATSGETASVGPAAASLGYQTLALVGVMSLSAGDQPEVLCADANASQGTEFTDGTITAMLVGRPSGTSGTLSTTRPAKLPRL